MRITPSPVVVLRTPTSLTTAPAGNQRGELEQIQPARSVAEAARGALTSTNAQMEGAEDVALTLGYRIRSQHQSGARTDRSTAAPRRALAGLLESQGRQAEQLLATLIEEYASLSDEELPARLAAVDLPAGVLAAILAALAGGAGLNSRRRQRLERMLDDLLAEDGWQLELLGLIEFGPGAATALPHLKELYRQAQSSADKPLSSWFNELRHLPDRRRRLRVLIRAIGFELSGEGRCLEGDHLAAVVTDLKRLLIFLGIEEQCALLANLLQLPSLQADDVLALIIDMIDASWMYEAWLRTRMRKLGIDVDPLVLERFCQRLKRLMQALPAPCFKDEEQRLQIIDSLLPLILEDEA